MSWDTGGTIVATGGRPKKADGPAKTKHVRINDDLADMLSWILKAMGKEWSSARLLDPHIRGPIKALYRDNEEAINILKRSQEKARKKRSEATE